MCLPRGVMDKAVDSGSEGSGSIPVSDIFFHFHFYFFINPYPFFLNDQTYFYLLLGQFCYTYFIYKKYIKKKNQLAKDSNLGPAVLEPAALSIGPRGMYPRIEKN